MVFLWYCFYTIKSLNTDDPMQKGRIKVVSEGAPMDPMLAPFE